MARCSLDLPQSTANGIGEGLRDLGRGLGTKRFCKLNFERPNGQYRFASFAFASPIARRHPPAGFSFQ
jgi:hypothetical protein